MRFTLKITIKNLSVLLLLLVLFSACSWAQEKDIEKEKILESPETIDLSKNWHFSPDKKNIGMSKKWYTRDFDDSQWDIIDAGKRWEDQGYPPLDSLAWYRKVVNIPSDWKGKPVWLKFGGVNDAYMLFINGKHLNTFYSRLSSSLAMEITATDVSGNLKYGEPNLITLQVNDWGNSGGIWRLPVIITTNNSEQLDFQRMKYNNDRLVVDLGVGLWAWPIPTDYDGDGDYDLLVSCPDKPYNGIYFFENTEGNIKMPVFKPGVKISRAYKNIQPSYINNQIRYLVPGKEITNLQKMDFIEIYPDEEIDSDGKKIRTNQWKYYDYDGDDALDLIVSIGDWTEYGWDNAFDKKGNWKNGPLHGYLYFIRNKNTTANPIYEEPKLIYADNSPIDVYGMPSANFADFDNDGDLDIICGEFLDKFTYFENIGNRKNPEYTSRGFLTNSDKPVTMDLEMIIPVAFDWDKDGDYDLIVGQEDGRVVFIENTGKLVNNTPQFKLPKFFNQQADEVKFGALVTPYNIDWDNDGDDDLICGNTAGYIGFIENLDGGNSPQWAEPVYLKADDEVIRIQAGNNGSIQGPCEAKWGYTTLSVGDWDHDGLHDIMINSIWGKILWYKNIGTINNPKLAAAKSIEVEWNDKNLKPS